MPFWYYLTVPKLPPDVAHQSNLVEIGEYLATEGTALDVGSPVALIENYWAFMKVTANGKGILRKTFFEPGTAVKIGDPIAVVGTDGEDLPYGKDSAVVEIVERKREKPTR